MAASAVDARFFLYWNLWWQDKHLSWNQPYQLYQANQSQIFIVVSTYSSTLMRKSNSKTKKSSFGSGHGNRGWIIGTQRETTKWICTLSKWKAPQSRNRPELE